MKLTGEILGYYSCADRYNPGVLQPHKWENAMTLDLSSWGYRRESSLSDYMTTDHLIATLATTVRYLPYLALLFLIP